ncbi:hypothetical protein HYH02_006831 [Chlamydomonas schloesseri]|uniref:DoxX family protein n=1 Tax=Chlamydomonas schloesseri TaxID=2026947 RepID=A0A835WIY9_9CHLO|nr:hypothetical protein HYH02_006831 [Chlamydomonas schloesseri]|eukprot:KAG2448247.1 hypothetical protein HYH02_006831 [Chlamydomonas schloesseri]
MPSPLNAPVLVLARFLLAAPFLVSCAITFVLLNNNETRELAVGRVAPTVAALRQLGVELPAEFPAEKLAVLLAVTQGLGGFLMVMNHHFGGFLLMLYLLPTTALTQQFWAVDPARTAEQMEVLGRFLQGVGLMGGVLAFMATTDGVPLKIKRPQLHKQHTD